MTPETPSLAMQMAGTALALVLVLALAWLALRGLKRLQGHATGATGGSAPQVLRSTAIGARERLVVVRHRDREYLLAIGAASVSLLDRWAADDDARPAP